jgi:hypothetical protein
MLQKIVLKQKKKPTKKSMVSNLMPPQRPFEMLLKPNMGCLMKMAIEPEAISRNVPMQFLPRQLRFRQREAVIRE